MNAQRVLLWYGGADVTERDALIADLLSMDAGADCVVSYLDAPCVQADEQALRDELVDTQVLVLWVTVEALKAFAAGHWPAEYRIAREKELATPILPIVKDDALFPYFTKVVGAVHGIAKTDGEYRVKLKKHLDAFLASEESMRMLLHFVFDAQVFLSYRKKDIHQARRFMKTLHSFDSFVAVSVWYDHDLTAGRVFSEEINESIAKSHLFVLLVTPTLLEKNDAGENNYVVATEYPFARQMGKPIAPVEAVPTDAVRVRAAFPQEDRPVSLDDPAALRTFFLERLPEDRGHDLPPDLRAYWLGTAYLKGFGVERDVERAIGLLTAAAEGEDDTALQATFELAKIYEYGVGVPVNYAAALPWRAKTATICERLHGPQDAITAAAYSALADVYQRQGEYESALEWYQKAIQIEENQPERMDQALAGSYNRMGIVAQRKGAYTSALEWYRKALDLLEPSLGVGAAETAEVYQNLATVYTDQGDSAKALEWLQKALSVYEKLYGDKHPSTASVYSNIAMTHFRKGDFPKALAWSQRARDIYESVHGKEHPETAMIYLNLGAVCTEQGNFPQAEEWLQKALAICESPLGSEHPGTALVYDNLAVCYQRQGDSLRALEMQKKALAIHERKLGKEHPMVATTYNNIGSAFAQLGEYPQALEWLEKALASREKALGPEHPLTARTRGNIALVYERQGKGAQPDETDAAKACSNTGMDCFHQGDYEKALEHFEKARLLFEKTVGPEHIDTALVYSNMGNAYFKQGQYDQAIAWLEKALAIRQRELGGNAPDTVTLRNNLAILRAVQGKPMDFRKPAGEKPAAAEPPPTTAMAYLKVAEEHSRKGETSQALACYQKALAFHEKQLGPAHPDTLAVYRSVVMMLYRQGNYQRAQDVALQMYRLCYQTRGINHPETKAAMQLTREAYLANGGKKITFPFWLAKQVT